MAAFHEFFGEFFFFNQVDPSLLTFVQVIYDEQDEGQYQKQRERTDSNRENINFPGKLATI